MMRNLLVAFAIALAGAVVGCKPKESGKPKVAVSIFPLHDVTRRIAGDRLDVVLVLPPGKSEHGYDPTPKEIAKLEGTKLGIAVGLDMDGWVEGIMKSAGGSPRMVHVGAKVPTIPIDVEPIGEAAIVVRVRGAVERRERHVGHGEPGEDLGDELRSVLRRQLQRRLAKAHSKEVLVAVGPHLGHVGQGDGIEVGPVLALVGHQRGFVGDDGPVGVAQAVLNDRERVEQHALAGPFADGAVQLEGSHRRRQRFGVVGGVVLDGRDPHPHGTLRSVPASGFAGAYRGLSHAMSAA